jgi:hypothetical protein
MIKIEIKTDNSAFEPDPNWEVARILRHLADLLNAGHDGDIPLKDINGNMVGMYAKIEEQQ